MRRFFAAIGIAAIVATCAILCAPQPHLSSVATATIAPPKSSLLSLAEDVAAGRRSARDLRDLALETIEPSAYASAVTASGLGMTAGVTKTQLWAKIGNINGGQSLATAFAATPCLSTTQPYSNVYVCDSTGTYPYDSGATSGVQYSWVSLSCGVTCTGAAGIRNNAIPVGTNQYPANITQNAELNTISAANTRTWLALSEGYGSYVQSSSDIGVGGQEINVMVKGGTLNPYAASLFEVAVNTALTAITISAATVGTPTVVTTSANDHLATGNKVYITGSTGMTELNGYFVATSIDATHFSVPVASTHAYTGSGKATSYGVRSYYWTHGETDSTFYTPISTYNGYLTGIIANSQTDFSAITGQTESINWYASQQSSVIGTLGGTPLTGPMIASNPTAEALEELIGTAHFFVSGPKYQETYCTNCGPHVSNVGQRHFGEKYGEVTDIVERIGDFKPLYPTSATLSGGTTIVLTYHVPVGCLSFSGTLTPSHQSGIFSNVWASGKGYEAYDATGLTVTGTTGTGVSPIVYTTGTNTGKIATNDYVCVGGAGFVVTNTNATVCGQATVVDTTHFSIAGTTGNGAYGGLFGTVSVNDLIPVTSATVTACNQVTLILGRAASTSLKLAYADAPDTYLGSVATGQAGCGNGGMCGLLQDGDAFAATYPGASGVVNPNYGVIFQDQAVPF